MVQDYFAEEGKPLDLALFHLINRGYNTPALDALMWWLTFLFKPPGLWAAVALALYFRKGGRRAALGLLFANLAAVPFEVIVKPLVGRVRPSFALPEARVLYEATSPAFPSGHAIVAFACAAVLWRYDRRAGVAALAVATLVGVSRIYVGNHWPSDVAAGALIGWLCGVGSVRFVDWLAGRRSPPAQRGA